MSEPVRVLGIAGSLRADSYNRALLRVAQELQPEGVEIEIGEIGDLTLYNQEQETTPPSTVQRLVEQAKAADAILIVTPEYNYSVPGVLKNAIDWLSRPALGNVTAGKPVAIMGASMGNLGTARAQYHLRQIGVYLNWHFVNQPEVMVTAAHTKFDAEGNLTDEPTKEFVVKLVTALRDWTIKLK
jgi:chromate reductase